MKQFVETVSAADPHSLFERFTPALPPKLAYKLGNADSRKAYQRLRGEAKTEDIRSMAGEHASLIRGFPAGEIAALVAQIRSLLARQAPPPLKSAAAAALPSSSSDAAV